MTKDKETQNSKNTNKQNQVAAPHTTRLPGVDSKKVISSKPLMIREGSSKVR